MKNKLRFIFTCKVKDPRAHTSPFPLKKAQQTCSRIYGNSSPQHLVVLPVTSPGGIHSALHLALHTRRWWGKLCTRGHEADRAVTHPLFGDRHMEFSKVTFLHATLSRLSCILETGFSMFPGYVCSSPFISNQGFRHHSITDTSTVLLPQYPSTTQCCQTQDVVVIRRYFITHTTQRQSDIKNSPSMTSGCLIQSPSPRLVASLDFTCVLLETQL